MSVAEFDATLQDRIFNKIKNSKRDDRKKYIDSLETAKLRKKYESAESGASSVFTASGLEKLKASLLKDVKNLEYAASASTILTSINYVEFAKFAISTFTSKGGSISDIDSTLRLSKVPQGKLQSMFLDYVSTTIGVSNISSPEKVYDYISANIQSGHLAGVFSLKIKEVLNLDITSTGPGYRDFTVSNNINEVTRNSLEMVLKALLDADYVSSNIYDREEIFATATKSVLGINPSLEIELQFGKDNKTSGDLLQQAGRNLNNLLDRVSGNAAKQLGQHTDREGTVESFTSLIKSLKPVADMLLLRAKELQVIDKNNTKVYSDILTNAANLNNLATSLIETKGSPSLKESLGQNIANLIGKGVPLKQIVTKLVKKVPMVSKDKGTLNINNIIKRTALVVKQSKDKLTKATKPLVRNPIISSKSYSLTSLQSLINSQLQDVISANMGDGDSKNVLNYRTGRFAASAQVERMSQSKEGAISAFYSYMRNPYGTFSEGGRQQNPKTRDPKLLIAKSIREIAATRVGNNLRAILI